MTPDLATRRQLRAALQQIEDLQAENAALRRTASTALASGLSPSVRLIMAQVEAEWDVTTDQLLGERQAAWIVEPRQVVMWLAAQRLRHSMPRIGSALRRDHTTVLHGIRVVSARLQRDPDFAARVQRVVDALNTPAEPEVQ